MRRLWTMVGGAVMLVALQAQAQSVPVRPGAEQEAARKQVATLRERAKQVRGEALQARQEAERKCQTKILKSSCLEEARKPQIEAELQAKKLESEARALEQQIKKEDRAAKQASKEEKVKAQEASAGRRAAQAREKEEKLERKNEKKEAKKPACPPCPCAKTEKK